MTIVRVKGFKIFKDRHGRERWLSPQDRREDRPDEGPGLTGILCRVRPHIGDCHVG